MKLYFPKTINKHHDFEQYFPEEVEINTLDEFEYVTQYDHLSVKMSEGRRLKEKFISTDLFYADIDNTDTYRCALEDFKDIFKEYEYYIKFSKSHQKIKISKNTQFEPADRFHVYFPIKTLDSLPIYEDLIRAAHDKYPFFDAHAKDCSRILFASDGAVEYHEGISVYDHFSDLAWNRPVYKPSEPIEKISDKTMLKVLKFASDQGEFEDYDSWLKLGIGLKAAGFEWKHWKELSHSSEKEKYIQQKWDSIKLRQDGITERHLYNIKEKYFSDMIAHLCKS